LYSFAFFIITSNTSILLSTELGIPLSSQSRAIHSHFESAIAGNIKSILSPSNETEFTRPGLLQKGIAATHACGLGLSIQIGTLVTS